MGKTAGEYQRETELLLMEATPYADGGYTPQDIRDRVKQLLEREKRTREICKKIQKEGKVKYCIYCGWSHGDSKPV